MNHDKKTGYFLPGHKVNQDQITPKEIRELKRKSKVRFLKMFYQYGSKTVDELVDIAKHPNALTPMQSGILKAWEQFSTNPDPAMFKYFMTLLGIPLDSKANMYEEKEDENEEPMIPMTKEERKRMLRIALDAVDNEE